MGTVSKNRGMSCVGVRKTGTTLIRVSTVMGTLYLTKECDCMDMIRILQLVALAFGVEELCNARKYYKQKKTRWAIASLCVGIFACARAIISITGIL